MRLQEFVTLPCVLIYFNRASSQRRGTNVSHILFNRYVLLVSFLILGQRDVLLNVARALGSRRPVSQILVLDRESIRLSSNRWYDAYLPLRCLGVFVYT